MTNIFREVLIGDKFVLRFYPSDNGWMCGITNEMIDALELANKALDAQRQWVGLTDADAEEVERWVEFKEEGSGRIPIGKLIRYIEAKLKEKNT